MARTRMEFREKLLEILESEGISNLYFSPPSNTQMKYPCIVYTLAGYDPLYADNKIYSNMDEYEVTVIDANPDSEIPRKVLELEHCTPGRFYVYDGLHHFPFTVYF